MTCDIVYRSDPSLVTLSQQVRLLQTKTPGASGDEEEEISPPEDLEVEEEEEEDNEEENEEDNSSNYEPNVRSDQNFEFYINIRNIFKEIATSKSDVPRNDMKPKSHACSKCKKTFSKVSLLNRHMKLHLGIKPYQCTVRVFGAFSCFYLVCRRCVAGGFSRVIT